ncbi:peptidase M23B [Salinispira pacifica]|uniref:Peptidase M23B n=2 Tax=Salinispira pacifica TaxID=1307761 RepID=V5WHE9_9SPIO|nr:peptidase M23B [Salinispira pacifica]
MGCGIVSPGIGSGPEGDQGEASHTEEATPIPGFIVSRPFYTPGSYFEAFAPEPADGYRYTLHLLEGGSELHSDSSEFTTEDLSQAREIPGIPLSVPGQEMSPAPSASEQSPADSGSVEDDADLNLYYFYAGFHSWMTAGEYTLRLRHIRDEASEKAGHDGSESGDAAAEETAVESADETEDESEDESREFTRDYTLRISPREFTRERIYLNRQLTDIRTDDSPRRFAETESLNELLLSSNSSARQIQLSEAARIPLDNVEYTSGFGDRRTYAYQSGDEAYSIHNGLDFRAPEGTPVFAPFSGEVVMAEDRIVSGKTVVLEHLPGVYTMYYHLSEIAAEEGDLLESGQELGTAGKTGLSTGSHLHWELRIQGAAVDPRDMLISPLLDKQRLNYILYGD